MKWLKFHYADIFSALVALATVGGWIGISYYIKTKEPIESWIKVNDIYVPDFVIGDEAKTNVVFNLNRRKHAVYDWTLTVRPAIKSDELLCFTSGGENMPDAKSPAEGLPLARLFADRACPWYPGDFKMEFAIVLHAEGYPMKFGYWESNVFKVIPQGSSLYVTPEQNKVLEELEPTVIP
jgi:hypothetical protein